MTDPFHDGPFALHDLTETNPISGEMPETFGGEFPSQEQLRAYGDLAFLFVRSDLHKNVSSHGLRSSIEPATDTGQFAILRQGHIPRAAVTWALLDDDAQARFIGGGAMQVKDWTSGTHLWIMDLVAPYGQGSGGHMLKWFRARMAAQHSQIKALRPSRDGNARVFTLTLMENGRWGSRMQSVART